MTSTPSGRVITVVDDDRSMRRSLRRLLKVSGWHVQTFASAEAFLAKSDSDGSGIVLIDIQLPGMTGLELLDRLRDRAVPCQAIAMSGSNDATVEAQALSLGAALFLQKPFDPQILLDTLEQMALGREKSRAC